MNENYYDEETGLEYDINNDNDIETYGPNKSKKNKYEIYISVTGRLILIKYIKIKRCLGEYKVEECIDLSKYIYKITSFSSPETLRTTINNSSVNKIMLNSDTREIVLTNENVNSLKDYKHTFSYKIDLLKDVLPSEIYDVLDHLFKEMDEGKNSTLKNYLDRYKNKKDISKEDFEKPIDRFASNRKFTQTEQDFVLMKAVEETIELSHAVNKLQKHEHKKLFAKDIDKYNVKDEREQRVMDVIEEFAHTKMYLEYLFEEYYTEINFNEEVEMEINKKLEFFRTMKISKPLL